MLQNQFTRHGSQREPISESAKMFQLFDRPLPTPEGAWEWERGQAAAEALTVHDLMLSPAASYQGKVKLAEPYTLGIRQMWSPDSGQQVHRTRADLQNVNKIGSLTLSQFTIWFTVASSP